MGASHKEQDWAQTNGVHAAFGTMAGTARQWRMSTPLSAPSPAPCGWRPSVPDRAVDDGDFPAPRRFVWQAMSMAVHAAADHHHLAADRQRRQILRLAQGAM